MSLHIYGGFLGWLGAALDATVVTDFGLLLTASVDSIEVLNLSLPSVPVDPAWDIHGQGSHGRSIGYRRQRMGALAGWTNRRRPGGAIHGRRDASPGSAMAAL